MYHIYTRESGEKVLVDEYFYNSYYDHDKDDHSMFPDSYEVLPVGRVIKGELDEELIEKLEEEGYQLSDTSFYVDMRGEFKDFSREDCEETAGVISFFAGAVIFCLIRYVTIASGLFPPVIPLRFLPTWRKYIVYYGVIYYGDSIKRIISMRKEG